GLRSSRSNWPPASAGSPSRTRPCRCLILCTEDSTLTHRLSALFLSTHQLAPQRVVFGWVARTIQISQCVSANSDHPRNVPPMTPPSDASQHLSTESARRRHSHIRLAGNRRSSRPYVPRQRVVEPVEPLCKVECLTQASPIQPVVAFYDYLYP